MRAEGVSSWRSYDELVAETLGAMYDPAAWPGFAEFLQALDELTSPEAAAASLQALRARRGALQQEDYPNFIEGFPGVACSETHNPSDVRAWSRAARAQDRQFPYFGRLLPRSRLLTLAGWGHTSLFASACVDAHVSTYLLTSRVPARGTVCQPDVVPFAEAAETAQALRAGGPSSKSALIPPAIRQLLER